MAFFFFFVECSISPNDFEEAMHWQFVARFLAALPTAIAVGEKQAVLTKPVDSTGSSRQTTRIESDDEAPLYRHDLVDLHRNIVSIESISGNEDEVGKWLVEYLHSRGFTADMQPVKPSEGTPEGQNRFNVLAWPGKSDKPQPKVIVSSHIDVVPPHIDYSIDDGELTKDTMIKGRGSSDAKGSVASMIIAVEQLLAAEKIKGDEVMFVFVVGEEVGGDGMITFSDSVAAALHLDEEAAAPRTWHSAIFGEPTENRLVCGHKGALFCDVTAKGVASHSGYPWLGKSANEMMVHAMSKVLAADLGSSELYGNTTVNVGRFDGGVAGNVVPEKALVKLGVRIAIGPEERGHIIVREKIEALLAEVDDGFEMSCTPGYGSVDCNCEVDGKYIVVFFFFLNRCVVETNVRARL